MSSVVISGDTSGAITLSAPAVSGTNTATLPAATGTVMVSGNMPAFSASPISSGTNCATATFTKITYDTENFDTNSNFASSRFTPTVAGYYQVSANQRWANSIVATTIYMAIYKNGSSYCVVGGSSNSTPLGLCPSTTVYMNGSTDYLEFYAYQNSGTTQATDTGSYYSFSGSMVRAA
jgi:hypothetical protein